MTREEAKKRVLDYVYDEMSPRDRADFEAAAGDDPEIRVAIEAVRSVRQAAAALPATPLSPRLRNRILAAARARVLGQRPGLLARLVEGLQKLFVSPAFAGSMVVVAAVAVAIHLIVQWGTEDPMMRADREERAAVRQAPAEAPPAPAVVAAPTPAEAAPSPIASTLSTAKPDDAAPAAPAAGAAKREEVAAGRAGAKGKAADAAKPGPAPRSRTFAAEPDAAGFASPPAGDRYHRLDGLSDGLGGGGVATGSIGLRGAAGGSGAAEKKAEAPARPAFVAPAASAPAPSQAPAPSAAPAAEAALAREQAEALDEDEGVARASGAADATAEARRDDAGRRALAEARRLSAQDRGAEALAAYDRAIATLSGTELRAALDEAAALAERLGRKDRAAEYRKKASQL